MKTFESLFDTFLAHLQKEHRLALAKQGVIVDANSAELPRQRNSREDNALIRAGKVPQAIAGQREGQGAQRPRRPLEQEE